MAITIQRTVQVYRDGLKLPWNIQNVATVDGIECVELNRRDTGLARFICGATKIADLSWPFEHLRELRNAQLCGGSSEATTGVFQKPLTSYGKRKLRLRAEGGQMETNFVILHLPEVAHGGESAPALELKVRRVSDLKKACQIELATTNLHYIRLATLAFGRGEPEREKRRRTLSSWSVPQKVTYVSKRKVFQAFRLDEDGKRRYKQFKPQVEENEEEMMRARDLAIAWSNHEQLPLVAAGGAVGEELPIEAESDDAAAGGAIGEELPIEAESDDAAGGAGASGEELPIEAESDDAAGGAIGKELPIEAESGDATGGAIGEELPIEAESDDAAAGGAVGEELPIEAEQLPLTMLE
eukprot:6492675-Amphidinium_carterae.1